MNNLPDITSDRVVLITGGTGSVGQEITKHLLGYKSLKKLIIFSRDEHKQERMYEKFEYDPRLRFFIGDIRDRDRLSVAFKDVTHVIHTAALKIVPSLEYNPFEATKTNVIGTQNVIDVAAEKNVRNVTVLSTDKAVQPINLYGATKLVAEKLAIAANNVYPGTNFNVCRYGNVTASNGSIVPKFADWRKLNVPLLITHPEMTRFWITLDEAAELILKIAFKEENRGFIYIPEMPSYNIMDLAKAFGGETKTIGIRPGEKLHETMVSFNEIPRTRKKAGFYIIYPEGTDRDLLYGIDTLKGEGYSSDKSVKLKTFLIRDKLTEMGYIPKEPNVVLS